MLLCYTKKHFCNKILAATCNTYWVRFAIRHHGFMCSDLHRTVESLTLASAALATKFSNSWNHIACEGVHGTFRAMIVSSTALFSRPLLTPRRLCWCRCPSKCSACIQSARQHGEHDNSASKVAATTACWTLFGSAPGVPNQISILDSEQDY